jgi:hypothetical protein
VCILSEKHTIRHFHHCANIRVYLHKSRWYILLYTPSLYYVCVFNCFLNNTKLNQARETDEVKRCGKVVTIGCMWLLLTLHGILLYSEHFLYKERLHSKITIKFYYSKHINKKHIVCYHYQVLCTMSNCMSYINL